MGDTLSLTIDSPELLEDELVALLWMHGGRGSWSEPLAAGRVRIHGFVGPECDGDRLGRALAIDPAVEISGLEAVPDRDWAADWRRKNGSIEVGRRFVVDPREPEEVDLPIDPGERILLRLPARTAFGMGSHASTRLAVELLESVDLAERDVVDVGTGSGILSFAALALGARRVVAFDVDPAAALLLPAYSALNGLQPEAFAGRLCSLSDQSRFDVALVNVIPLEIAADLPRLAFSLRPGGVAIFSGILEVEAERALAAMSAAGFRERERRIDGEWIAFRAERIDAGRSRAELDP
jgi:ribosomal protein L11 methyltransferase